MITVGQTPISLRQLSAAAFAGERPQNLGADVYSPVPIEGQFTYADIADHTKTALAQGGLFDFGDSQAVRILEIRALAALGNISIIVTDREDLQTMTLTVGGSTPTIDLVALGVSPGDSITVYVDAAGTTEIFKVKRVIDATHLVTEEIHPGYALVAPDVFTIAAPGGVARYTHTMATTNTLDIDPITTHDVPLGTPATSFLGFTLPLIVTPSQVLMVSTVSAAATGWIDVYAVKADFY